jgi:hypothetical protein
MKITIKEKSIEKVETPRWEDLPAGAVIEYTDGVRGIKCDGSLDKPGGILLIGDEGEAFEKPTPAVGYLSEKFKVIGKLSEIIVEGI